MKRTALTRLSTATLVFSLTAVPVALTGCGSTGSVDSEPAPAALAEAVSHEVILTVPYSGVTSKGVMLIDSVEDLNALSDELKPKLNPEELEGSSLIVVSLGEQPTGGYSVTVDSVAKLGDTLIVEYTPTAPAPDDTVTQAITMPAAVVKIPQTDVTKVTGIAN